MEVIKNILINYWPQILAVILFVASFILQILKKKPLGNVFALICSYCIEAVKAAEEHPVSGKEKKELAIDYVYECIKVSYPTLNVSRYHDVISMVIEEILSTPQKKGGNQ